jgi:hypothetical protein
MNTRPINQLSKISISILPIYKSQEQQQSHLQVFEDNGIMLTGVPPGQLVLV